MIPNNITLAINCISKFLTEKLNQSNEDLHTNLIVFTILFFISIIDQFAEQVYFTMYTQLIFGLKD